MTEKKPTLEYAREDRLRQWHPSGNVFAYIAGIAVVVGMVVALIALGFVFVRL